MANEEIIRRLDLIQATLMLAFEPELERALGTIRANGVSAAILDASGEWVASTDLQAKAAKESGKSARAVRDHLPQLVETGLLETRGTERRMEYKRTKLA